MSTGGVPGWAVLAVTVGTVPVGWRTALILRTGGYRIPEDRVDRPPRGPWWWPVPALAGLGAFATWHVGDIAGGAALPAYLLFAWLTVALVWIDLDVHRLPFGLVVPATPAAALLLAVASVAAGGRHWLAALVGAVLVWLLYLVLALLPGGGLGGGDVRLAPIVGMTLGWLGPVHLAVGTMAAFVLGGFLALLLLLTGRAGPRTAIAFGPAMCLGVFVAIGWTPGVVGA